jgi:hypothetical protein
LNRVACSNAHRDGFGTRRPVGLCAASECAEADSNLHIGDVISISTEVLARAELEKAAKAVPGMEIPRTSR